MDLLGLTRPTALRCDPLEDKAALALAAQAWPESERAAYWRTIGNLVKTGQNQHVVLWSIRDGDRLVAAQIAQSLPGRAAVVWPPQNATDSAENRNQIASILFAGVLPDLATAGAQLAQSLVGADEASIARLFAIGGFSHAADLLYLVWEVEGTQPRAALPFELAPIAANEPQRLISLIDRTYVGTLDCPRIDGFRQTADVVAGYQAVGQFRPELWSIVRHEGTDVGCLLVNLHPDVQHAEIVYVALVPEVRGRGWGRLLAQQAQGLAAQTHSQRVVLAVDAANDPAVRMYSDVGFSVFDRRAVWIRPLA